MDAWLFSDLKASSSRSKSLASIALEGTKPCDAGSDEGDEGCQGPSVKKIAQDAAAGASLSQEPHEGQASDVDNQARHDVDSSSLSSSSSSSSESTKARRGRLSKVMSFSNCPGP